MAYSMDYRAAVARAYDGAKPKGTFGTPFT